MGQRCRSWLFVPGDSDRKIAKAEHVPADTIILDLEDAVAESRKDVARQLVLEYLQYRSDHGSQKLFVRINSLDSGCWRDDLISIVKGEPDGVMLPKATSGRDVAVVSATLEEVELKAGIAAQSIQIVPITFETPQAIFDVGSYRGSSTRLAALTWGAEDLIAAMGTRDPRDDNGDWQAPYQLARSLCLFGARSAEVLALDTVHAAFDDLSGLVRSCKSGRQLGFDGKLAIHPNQVGIINEEFCPTPEELEFAQRVVRAFESYRHAGTVSMDGQMLDIVHLKNAQRVLLNAGDE